MFYLVVSPLSPLQAGAAEMAIRQNHLLFQFTHDDGRMVCAIQEIVVVELAGNAVYENPAGTLRLSFPENAQQVAPLPVPDLMPGMASDPMLRGDEMEILPGHILVKRSLRPGKNTFSYGYLLPASGDSVRLEKKVLLPTRLLAAFAPKVQRLTSQALQVESAEDGYRIMGHGLAVGSTIDLVFEGLHAALVDQDPPGARRDGSALPPGQPSNPAVLPVSMSTYVVPSVAGLLLAVLLFLYLKHLKLARSSGDMLRQWVMDEIEVLDEAVERKEISAEYHKRKKKALMDRLRLM